MEPEIIQRFLESVGNKADVDLYLKLFRAQKKESFAIIAAGDQIVKHALDPVHFDLRILAGLGLSPVVLLGLYEGREADRQAVRVKDWLVEDAVPAQIVSCGPDINGATLGAIRGAIQAGEIPLVSLEAAKDVTAEGRFRLLATMAEALETRKLIYLSRRSGLEQQNGKPLSVVNLTVDYEPLLISGTLSRRQASLLRQVKQLLERVPHRMSVAVVNPLHLLRELFTVNGAGTLIRRGSRIDSFPDLDRLDHARLLALIESAFGKKLREGFLLEAVDRVYVEEAYHGAALLRATPVGVYLTKFAVDRPAQGEGIGTELWSAITRDYPSFFWRARPTNSISPWYVKQCDGMIRFPDWHVFWRGLSIDQIEPAVRYALAAPVDFLPAPPVGT
jgi:GNAT superfamily N-acetyltransferase